MLSFCNVYRWLRMYIQITNLREIYFQYIILYFVLVFSINCLNTLSRWISSRRPMKSNQSLILAATAELLIQGIPISTDERNAPKVPVLIDIGKLDGKISQYLRAIFARKNAPSRR